MATSGKRSLPCAWALPASPRYWINLQSRYDMDVAEDALSEQVAREVRPMMVAV
jgi:plasmid maintenance system antidote protein VapI